MKKQLSTATIPALFTVPGLEMLLVGFKTLFDVVLSSFGVPYRWKIHTLLDEVKIKWSFTECSQRGECVNDWGKTGRRGFATLIWAVFCAASFQTLCVSWSGDMLIAWSYAWKPHKTWPHGSYLELKCMLFILEVKNKSTGTSPSPFSIRFHILPLAQVVQMLLSPFGFVYFLALLLFPFYFRLYICQLF